MSGFVRDRYGAVKECAFCGKQWYVPDTDAWVLKRMITPEKHRHKIVFFCKPSCKWKFDSIYDAELEQKKAEAERKRKETKMKKRPECRMQCGKKPEAIEHTDKVCKDCLYAEKGSFGFWYCAFKYNAGAYRPACAKYKDAR